MIKADPKVSEVKLPDPVGNLKINVALLLLRSTKYRTLFLKGNAFLKVSGNPRAMLQISR